MVFPRENTVVPPSGWEHLTDADGSHPAGWFTKRHAKSMHWVKADYDNGKFTYRHRRYITPVTTMDGQPVSHTWANLDFCGGWHTEFRGSDEGIAMVDRIIAGLKPAGEAVWSGPTEDVTVLHDLQARASAAGLLAVPTVKTGQYGYDTFRLWVAPRRLDDRLDHSAMLEAWITIIKTLPAADRNWAMDCAHEGLKQAFFADLGTVTPEIPAFQQPWWRELLGEDLVGLGTILGYPPLSTLAILYKG